MFNTKHTNYEAPKTIWLSSQAEQMLCISAEIEDLGDSTTDTIIDIFNGQ